MIFVDYKHEACNGEGCEECDGSGIVGECLPESHLPLELRQILECLPFSEDMQDARRPHRIILGELSKLTGISASRLSAIENATAKPTEEEQTLIREALKDTWPTAEAGE